MLEPCWKHRYQICKSCGEWWSMTKTCVKALATHGCDPWGKPKQVRLKSQMRSQMRQLQELSWVHERVYVLFFSLGHDWELRSCYCYVMHGKPDGTVTSLRCSVETSWYPMIWNSCTVMCGGGTANNRHPLLKMLQKHQLRSKLLQIKCVLAFIGHWGWAVSRRRFSVQGHLQALSASTLKQKTSEKRFLKNYLDIIECIVEHDVSWWIAPGGSRYGIPVKMKDATVAAVDMFPGVLVTLVLRGLHVAALRRTLHMRQADADAAEEAVGFMGSEELWRVHLTSSQDIISCLHCVGICLFPNLWGCVGVSP